MSQVTAVVVTWNGGHLLRPCLDALRAQTLGPAGLDICVVDNASVDGTVELLTADYPDVRLIRSDRNRGFAGGANLGLRAAQTPYVALVNNDATLEPDALERLVNALSAPGAERVAAATAKVLLAPRFAAIEGGPAAGAVRTSDGRTVRPDPAGELDVINSTGNVVRVDGYGQDRDWLSVDRGERPSGAVFGFCGAAVLLRTAALEDVGHFDEDFFLYYEDTDLSWRLRRAGWEIRYVAEAVARHEHGASSREGSPTFRFHDDRNRLLTLTKNASLPLLLRTVPRYALTTASMAVREAPRLTGIGLRLRVMGSYLRLLPRMLRRRAQVERDAVVRRREVERLLAPTPRVPTSDYRPSA